MLRLSLIFCGVVLFAGCGKKPARNSEPAGAKAGGDQQPRVDSPKNSETWVVASPTVGDVVKAAGKDAEGRKVVIGNIKITMPNKLDGRAKYDIDYWVLQPPGKDKIFRCHVQAASGELGSLDIPPEAGKGGHVTGYNVVTPEFRPPFTVKVDEFDFLTGRNGAVQVSNSFEVR